MMQSFDFMTFPLTGSRLIEASAGAGKTYSLVLLYIRLILGHGGSQYGFQRPLSPKDILVVTFTNAAVAELRDRIRSRLVEAARMFQAAHTEEQIQLANSDPLYRLRADFPVESWQECAWRLRLASEAMDEASISTIHSWCQRVLSEHAFASGGRFDRELIRNQSLLIKQIVKDYWRRFFYPLDESRLMIVHDFFASPQQLHKGIEPLLKSNINDISFVGQLLSVNDFNQINDDLQQAVDHRAMLAELEQQACQAWLEDWQQIQAYLQQIRHNLKATSFGGSQGKFEGTMEALYQWALGAEKAPSQIKYFAINQFTFLKNKQLEVTPYPAFIKTQDWLDAKKDTPNTSEYLIEAKIKAHATCWVKQEISRINLKQGQTNDDGLLTDLAEALSAPEQGQVLSHIIAEHYPVAMIDEFQDTDPIQLEIFDRIYQLDKNLDHLAVVMIGDPKQAIYSFRGADIFTYLKAKQSTENRHYSLGTNYRSTPALVQACNYVFEQAEQFEQGAFRFKQGNHNPFPFSAVKANNPEQQLVCNGVIQPAMTWCPIVEPEMLEQQQETVTDKSLSTGQYRYWAAEAAASQIVDWLEGAAQRQVGFATQLEIEHPLEAKDLAILVRSGKEAKVMQDALNTRQIASVYLSDKTSLFVTQEAQDMLCWMFACAEPDDPNKVRQALATNTLDIAIDQLIHWQQQDLAWEQQMLTFSQFESIWQERGILAMIRALMDHYHLPARLLSQQQGERRLTNLLHLAEWLQQAAAEIDGETNLARHLLTQIEEDEKQQEMRLESDADRVKVITIHKAKGLEYPVVLLPFICSWKAIDGREKMVKWQSEQGWYQEIAGNKHFEQAWQKADQQRLSEDMRLLYVALTRASHALWLGIGALVERSNSKTPKVEYSAVGHLLNGGQSFKSADEVFQQYQQLAEGCKHIRLLSTMYCHKESINVRNLQSRLGEARKLTDTKPSLPWWIASYSSIHYAASSSMKPAAQLETAHHANFQELQDEPNQVPDSRFHSLTSVMHQFPSGALWGTFLHNLLERLAEPENSDVQQGFHSIGQPDSPSYQQLLSLCQFKGIAEYAPALRQWLNQLLTMPWQFTGTAQSVADYQPNGLILNRLTPQQRMVEMAFLFTSNKVSVTQLDEWVCQHILPNQRRPKAKPATFNGLLKGFIDLVVEYQGRYYVVDWKSNRLGDDDAAYSIENMTQAILKKRYDLQYVLYSLSLHRHLRVRLPQYDYEKHFGGVVYVFLRGLASPSQGLFYDRPCLQLIDKLDGLFSGGGSSAQGYPPASNNPS